MSLRIDQEDFCSLSKDWTALLSACDQPTVFQTPVWHKVWWDHFSAEGRLSLLAGRDRDALVGVAPFMYQGSTLLFLGDTDLWDYHAVSVAGGREADFFPALFDYLDGQPWDSMDLRSLPGNSPTFTYFQEMAQRRGYATEVSQEDVSPGVALPATWDQYLGTLSKKDRHELRRKLRRLESQASYSWYSVDGIALQEGVLDDFFNLMRGSRQDKAVFLTDARESFFRRMVGELARMGALKLFFMELAGQRVATAMCFDYGQIRFLYNSGYNPEYAHLSVGLLLKGLCLRQAIEEGKTYFDFLRGDERYKYDLGAKDVILYKLVVRR